MARVRLARGGPAAPERPRWSKSAARQPGVVSSAPAPPGGRLLLDGGRRRSERPTARMPSAEAEARYRGTMLATTLGASFGAPRPRYDIDYDDGDKETRVSAELIRSLESGGGGRDNTRRARRRGLGRSDRALRGPRGRCRRRGRARAATRAHCHHGEAPCAANAARPRARAGCACHARRPRRHRGPQRRGGHGRGVGRAVPAMGGAAASRRRCACPVASRLGARRRRPAADSAVVARGGCSDTRCGFSRAAARTARPTRPPRPRPVPSPRPDARAPLCVDTARRARIPDPPGGGGAGSRPLCAARARAPVPAARAARRLRLGARPPGGELLERPRSAVSRRGPRRFGSSPASASAHVLAPPHSAAQCSAVSAWTRPP